MLIRNASLPGSPHTDVRWRGGRIVECATGLRPLPGEDDLDARGGWLLPGLHDHHVHLRALAAQAGSVPVGPPGVRDATEFAAALRRADAELPAGQWIRGVGYHESVAGPLDRTVLDHLVPDRPVRIQHRSGALWVLNSRGCQETGANACALAGVERDTHGAANGRLWRLDSWLGTRVRATTADPALISARAAAAGVTGYTDATPGLSQDDVHALGEAVAAGTIRQRVHCMAPPGVTDPGQPRFSLGPTKILLDDTTLPPLPEFVALVRAAHLAARPVAVHCVTRVQLILTIAAIEEAGVLAGDRIEHGAMVPADSMEWLRRNGIPVITQPHFPVERAEQYAREVAAEDRCDLWRLGSLQAAGVGVAAGTDAPFGDPDPWRVVRAAIEREPGPERLSLAAALALFAGHPARPTVPRGIAAGEAADLTLLRVPPQEVTVPDRDLVAATIVDGAPVHVAIG
ncbi:amidohydrolase family protein [Nocardia gipuzkoensis]|uniref:amidohydrolase family protein n=1 Tax=Nocardia gipuzkoensis TaxID=2749991 RepID=UPI001E4BC772|nr:amidohydrolase family protein [Nocardia gipuzkoensis]UGT67035.1 amidohydrolase family protein [Nocardia gipuzkoensis]